MTWRDLPSTRKQMEFIETAYDFSEFPVPYFEGTTRGEASDWIDKYGKTATEWFPMKEYGGTWAL